MVPRTYRTQSQKLMWRARARGYGMAGETEVVRARTESHGFLYGGCEQI